MKPDSKFCVGNVSFKLLYLKQAIGPQVRGICHTLRLISSILLGHKKLDYAMLQIKATADLSLNINII